VWWVVLDEADRMLDIGFRPDIERILRRCPEERQTLLLSATVPPAIQRLAQRYMFEPVSLDFSPMDVSVETIEQSYFTVHRERKYDLLLRLIKREEPRQAIIFCRTKRGTERLYQRLEKKVESVACIHGDLQQHGRDKVMGRFREGKLRYLVATDVVGRGIDVSGISHIINFDIPEFCDDYVHRVGRTGRMGREGIAFTFVSPEEGPQLTRIEQRINRQLQRDHIEDFEFDVPETSVAPSDEPKPAPPPVSDAIAKRPVKRYRRGL
jgi:ATP-dependent RNA helicase DeaD